MAELFDFSGMMNQLTEHEALSENRRTQVAADATKRVGVMERSAALASEYDQGVEFLRQSVATSRAKAEKGRALADSQNPLDTLRLMGLQMMDPAGFNRQARSARLAEDMQTANAMGQLHNISQASLEAELLVSGANVDQAKALESISMERLRTLQDQAAMMQGNFAASETMKSLAIAGLDEKQLEAAIQLAQSSPNKKANVGGIDVEPLSLQNRLHTLKEMTHERKIRGLLRQTEVFAAEEAVKDIPNQAANADARRKIDAATRANVDTEILLKNAGLQSQVSEFFRQSQQRELAHMTVEELSAIRGGQYIAADGEKFTPSDVDEAYVRSNTARSDSITQQIQTQMLSGYDTDKVVSESNRVKELRNRYKASSSLGTAADQYLQTLSFASLGVGADQPIGVRVTAVTAMSQARAAFEDAITKQVKVETKDADLQEMLTAYYKGDPVPTETLMNAVSSRLEKGRSLADVFPPEIAIKVQRQFSTLFQDKKKANLGLGSADDKMLRAEAAQEAVDMVMGQEVAKRADPIFLGQVMAPSHPLAKISPTGFASLARTADMRAFNVWMEQAELSQEDAQVIADGGMVSSLSEEENMRLGGMLREAQNLELIQQLEAQEPGLGSAYVSWWRTEASSYLDRLVIPSAGAGLTDDIATSMVGERVKDRLTQYGAEIQMSDQSLKANTAQRFADMISFQGNPEAAQIVILDATKELHSGDKRRVFMEVIKPLVDQAKASELSFEDATAFIEQGIQNADGADPAMKNILKNLRRARQPILDHISAVRHWGGWMAGVSGSSAWHQQYLDSGRPTTGYLDWYPGNMRALETKKLRAPFVPGERKPAMSPESPPSPRR